MAQVIFPGGGNNTPCSEPEILAEYACDGVVTLSASPVNPNASYSWNLGNGSTATGPGPITVVYPGGGPYTVTLTLGIASGNTACQASSSVAVTPTQGGGCCPVGIAANHLLGNAGATTTLNASQTFSGDWRVLGNLVLTNGNYILNNATFYVDGMASKTPMAGGGYQRTVSGSTITVGRNATLTLNNSTLTASSNTTGCPMWRGVVLDNNGQIPAGANYQLVVQNNSTISHALCAVEVAGNGLAYRLEQSTFANNLTHVYDNSTNATGQLSIIANNTFTSDPVQMHLPYNQGVGSDKWYTYQALCLTPSGNSTLDVHDNTITQAVYGIVNNIYDRTGVVQIHDNVLLDIYHTGIWAVDKLNGGITASISGNRVALNSAPGVQTEQIDLQATMYGIYTEETGRQYTNSFEQNFIRGDGINQKPLVGMALFNAVDVSGNWLANLTDAIHSTAQDGVIFDNYIAACDKGIVIVDGSAYSSYQTTLSCNTFYEGSGGTPGPGSSTTAIQYAIEVQPNAYLNDQGSASSPAANKFEGNILEAIHNDGSAFTYWYATSSPQEALVTSAAFGSSAVAVQPATIPAAGWTNYCSGRGATTGNGVNARGTVLSAATIAALADSVRLRQVPLARRRAYLYEVLNYYQGQNQLAALEVWWATLLLPNVEDYRTTGLALLRAYDVQRAPAAALRVLALLQPQALVNAEVAAALQYRLVRQHLPLTTPLLARADSVVLRTLAWSGTSVAERAGQWLHYFYPRLPLPAPPAHVVHTASRAALPKTTAAGVMLGGAYPNPTQAEANITYQLPRTATRAEISFTDLLTGRVQLTIPLKSSTGDDVQTVQVPHLPAGQYMYRLLVNGQPVAIPQRLVVR